MSASKLLDSAIHAHFLAEVQPDFDFFKTIFMLVILLRLSYTEAISSPGHAKEAGAHFTQDLVGAGDLLIDVAILIAPSVQVVLHVALVGICD